MKRRGSSSQVTEVLRAVKNFEAIEQQVPQRVFDSIRNDMIDGVKDGRGGVETEAAYFCPQTLLLTISANAPSAVLPNSSSRLAFLLTTKRPLWSRE
jgi:hypothetical protein